MPHRQDIMISAKQAKGSQQIQPVACPLTLAFGYVWDKIYIYKEGGESSNHVQKCEKLRVKNIVVQHIARLFMYSGLVKLT